MKALVLRLDAPIMSFGGVIVDRHGYTDRFPGTSMLCGLIANALGWSHGDFNRLQSLQARIEFAARWDVPPQRLVDYHTADLGQPKMREDGWTTRGIPEHRAGGTAAKYGTHERNRHYWTDGLMTVALAVTGVGDPEIETIKEALTRPARPLFLGRKACLPTRPLLDPDTPVLEGADVLSILRRVTVWNRHGEPGEWTSGLEACWPADVDASGPVEVRRVYDLRDWANQLPTGSRRRAAGLIKEGR